MAGSSQQSSESNWAQNYFKIKDSTEATCNICGKSIFDFDNGKFKLHLYNTHKIGDKDPENSVSEELKTYFDIEPKNYHAICKVSCREKLYYIHGVADLIKHLQRKHNITISN